MNATMSDTCDIFDRLTNIILSRFFLNLRKATGSVDITPSMSSSRFTMSQLESDMQFPTRGIHSFADALVISIDDANGQDSADAGFEDLHADGILEEERSDAHGIH